MSMQLECACGFVAPITADQSTRPEKCPRCGGILLVGDGLPPRTKKVVVDDDDTTPYGLSKIDTMRSGVTGHMGRIRVTNEPVAVRCLAMAEREPIALASADDRVVILDILEKARIGSLKGHEARVTCGAITPDGATAITGDRDGQVLVWDVAKRERLARFNMHDDTVASLGISPDGRFAVSAGEDNRVRLWRTKNGKEFELKKSHWISPARAVAFAPDGNHVLAAGDKIVLWDFDTGEVVHRLDALAGGISGVTFSADGKYMAAAGAKEVRVFRWERDTATPDLMLAVPPSDERQIFSAALAVGAEHLVTVSSVVTGRATEGEGIGGVGMGVTFLAFGIVGAIVINEVVRASSAKGPARTIAVEVWKIGGKERGAFFPISLPPMGRISVLASSAQHRLLVGAADGYVQLFAFL